MSEPLDESFDGPGVHIDDYQGYAMDLEIKCRRLTRENEEFAEVNKELQQSALKAGAALHANNKVLEEVLKRFDTTRQELGSLKLDCDAYCTDNNCLRAENKELKQRLEDWKGKYDEMANRARILDGIAVKMTQERDAAVAIGWRDTIDNHISESPICKSISQALAAYRKETE